MFFNFFILGNFTYHLQSQKPAHTIIAILLKYFEKTFTIIIIILKRTLPIYQPKTILWL